MNLEVVFERAILLAATLSLLASCGGGGEQQITPAMPPAPPPAETIPFKLTDANIAATAGQTVALSEAILQTAQLVIDAIDQARINQVLASSSICPNGSPAHYTLTDKDNDGIPTTGDTIEVSYFHCYQNSVDDIIVGDMAITLSTPASSGDWLGNPSYSASVEFTPSFRVGPLKVNGSLNVAVVRNGLNSTLSASSTTDDDWAVTILADDGKEYKEAAHSIKVSKLLDYSSARAISDLSLVYQSQTLGGQLELDCPALSSYFGTYPDQGLIDVIGFNKDTIRLVPRVFPGNSTLDLYLYPAGNTNVPASAQAVDVWSEFNGGFLWWEPISHPTIYQVGYPSKELDLTDFSLLFARPTQGEAVAADEPMYLQFSHRLDTTRIPPVRLTTSNGTNVPASVEIDGARVTITSQQPLQAGAVYQLSFDGPFHDQNVSNVWLNQIIFVAA